MLSPYKPATPIWKIVDEGFVPIFVIGVITLIIVPSGDCNLKPIDLGKAWESWTDNVTNSTKSFDAAAGFVTVTECDALAPLSLIARPIDPESLKLAAKVPLLFAVYDAAVVTASAASIFPNPNQLWNLYPAAFVSHSYCLIPLHV